MEEIIPGWTTYHSNWASRKLQLCPIWGSAHVQTQLSHRLVLGHSADRRWSLFLETQNMATEYNLGRNNKTVKVSHGNWTSCSTTHPSTLLGFEVKVFV